MQAVPRKTVLGMDVNHIRISGSRARWGRERTMVVERFMTENVSFLAWKVRYRFHVTEATLRTFSLRDVYPLIGADGLDGITNVDGQPILPILDKKIRWKMTQVFKMLGDKAQKAVPNDVASLSGQPPPVQSQGSSVSRDVPVHLTSREHTQLLHLLKAIEDFSSSTSSASSQDAPLKTASRNSHPLEASQLTREGARRKAAARLKVLLAETAQANAEKAQIIAALKAFAERKEFAQKVKSRGKGKGKEEGKGRSGEE